MKTHKDLDAYNYALDLTDAVYEVTKKFPEEEKFCLTNQMRRAAISVPSNIAEGAARHGEKEFVHFLYIALGSLTELDTQNIISKRQKLIEESDYHKIEENINRVKRKLIGLIKSIKSKRT